jgi:hypothetical protein
MKEGLPKVAFNTIDWDTIDKIHTDSCTYVHVLSLCHLYPFTHYLKNTNENFQKRYFSCAILLTTLHLREMN